MTEEYMKTSDIGVDLGHTNPGSTRRWIANRKLEAKARDTKTGEKLYSRSDYERAKAGAPGQGTRTDLRELAPSEGPPPHDRDRGLSPGATGADH